MKHGPIALIDEWPTVVVKPARRVDKMVSQVEQIKRGAAVLAVASGRRLPTAAADYVLPIPAANEFILPILTLPLQLFAYEIARRKGWT